MRDFSLRDFTFIRLRFKLLFQVSESIRMCWGGKTERGRLQRRKLGTEKSFAQPTTLWERIKVELVSAEWGEAALPRNRSSTGVTASLALSRQASMLLALPVEKSPDSTFASQNPFSRRHFRAISQIFNNKWRRARHVMEWGEAETAKHIMFMA